MQQTSKKQVENACFCFALVSYLGYPSALKMKAMCFLKHRWNFAELYGVTTQKIVQSPLREPKIQHCTAISVHFAMLPVYQ
jgi:hypothetical protein